MQGAYDFGMGHHNDPMDPRNPMSPAFYYTFIDKGGNGGRRGGSPNGCGCWVFFLLAFVAGVLIAAIVNN